ncbi:MAG: SDR family oxidoreductase [Hydrococcus sp. Prado102]|jgi:acyl transferase domain-containing protein/acyl carrier protein|nr:SDR family oxidoreductase [Hydrococcus sp. Prado102]
MTNTEINELEIAIIGMSGRFPGAKNVDEFWNNLQKGIESISFFTDEELADSVKDKKLLNAPNFVKAKGILENAELFDASFFGFNPREAEITDPQHRLFLECAWEALENAGYDSQQYQGSIGVYGGSSLNSYFLNNVYPNLEFLNAIDGHQLAIASDKDFLTTRISYKLNLEGPSYTVQTACSTSLVAVHLACQSLLNGECDMALAGGVSVDSPRKSGYLYQEGDVSSPDGHCRAFDAKAQGTGSGEGVGIVVLKRMEDAISDGDNIYAVIKGSAINNDGSFKVSYTAPRIDSQAKVIRMAQVVAEVEPETIDYIETHGSGTVLGDPIEIAALTQAFRTDTNKKGFCAIGSLKTNIGHLDAAAGVAGLIKTVLALKNQQIPPSLHFEQPNPKIDFANSPFYVNTKLSEWNVNGSPRRAGVSSFGIGGTNAHVILEEPPFNSSKFKVQSSKLGTDWELLLLSAKTPTALDTITTNLVEHLKKHPDLNLADVAYTLQIGRRAFEHRRMVVCQNREDGINALQDPKRVLTSFQEPSNRPVAFMFTGLGTHYTNMGWELYQTEPTFREQVDLCCNLLSPLLNLDLRDIIYPDRHQIPSSNSTMTQSGLDLRKMLSREEKPADEATQKLNQTYLTQPAVFVIEYALAQLLMAWGIRPVATIGYSIGEYVAACISGVLSLEDALTLVAKRAQMIQELPPGAMLAVPLSEEQVRPYLDENLSLSAINGSSVCVVAGTNEAVERLERELSQQGLAVRRIETSHAFHSQMMNAIAQPFTELVKTVKLHPPQIPYLSNVTGTWISAEQATNPSYWTQHLCQTVRFADGVQQLWQKHRPILLEIGAGQTLGSLALQCLEGVSVTDKVVLPSLKYSYDRQSDVRFLLNTLGQLWLSGISIDWSRFYENERRHRQPLPTYPFERQRYWIDSIQPKQLSTTEKVSLEKKPDMTDWFYVPIWKQSILPSVFKSGELNKAKSCWLVFVDECGIACEIATRLVKEDRDVVIVKTGEKFSQVSDREYVINIHAEKDYQILIENLQAKDKIPDAIVHGWSISSNDDRESGVELFKEIQHLGFYSLLFLTKALDRQIISKPINIWVLSNNMYRVESQDILTPEKTTLLGVCKVIPQEYSNLTCQSIDLVLPSLDDWSKDRLIDRLMAELSEEISDLAIAYRGNNRWVQTFEPIKLDKPVQTPTRLREGGVYLITGGLGNIALTFAKYLAQSVRAKLVLTSRSGLPEKDEWDRWLVEHNESDRISNRIRKFRELEALGSEVLVIKADVASELEMQQAIAQAEKQFGQIHGVIHAATNAGEFYKTIPETGYFECDREFQPKIYGTYTLAKILQNKELDYCLLISSIASVLGGVAVSAYTAANIFVDAFADKQNQRDRINWFSVNWFHAEAEDGNEESFQQETTDAFQRILSNNSISQTALWRSDLNVAINKWVKRELSEKEIQIQITKPALYPRSNLRNSYVEPSNELESKIAKRYQELLGIEQVGIHDNFFDLGGNSLIGTQLVSLLRQDFKIQIPLLSILEAPTVEELALVIEEIVIEKLENLTEEEANLALK